MGMWYMRFYRDEGFGLESLFTPAKQTLDKATVHCDFT